MNVDNLMVETERDVCSLLIELIQNYPFLLNTNHKFYKNNTKKEAAWQEIASTINISSKYIFCYVYLLKSPNHYYTITIVISVLCWCILYTYYAKANPNSQLANVRIREQRQPIFLFCSLLFNFLVATLFELLCSFQ